MPTRSLLAVLLLVGAAALKGHDAGVAGLQRGHEAGRGHEAISDKGHQTPEELGFTSDEVSRMRADFCLDLGAKGFPLPVFEMLQAVDWDARQYFEQIQSKGYAEDALQMTGPQDAMMGSDCMKAGKGKVKHIFVGDSQMMSLRNAFHRLNRCPEIWWDGNTTAARKSLQQVGRLHSGTQQAPDGSMDGCKEEGVASFIYWDAWARRDLPVAELKREMDQLGLEPKDGDTVVVWVGSNYIAAMNRMGALTDAIDRMHELGVKLVWDSPTFPDTAIMTAVSTHDEGRDPHSRVPITYTSINARKSEGKLGSNMYKSEKALMESGIEIPMTKRWQLTNRYRGLQCDGIHTDMRARDAAFYDTPCPGGEQFYGKSINGCNWVETFNKAALADFCPAASGLDDLVLQSGLYSICAAHETPFCYQHTEHIR